ncbi:hypothetical protein M072_3132 [Bacteroides fragilis str. DS-208]|nr:hypothetical protein M072_3132 [Bacteroides fragilis str. DS-208]
MPAGTIFLIRYLLRKEGKSKILEVCLRFMKTSGIPPE